MEVEEETLNNGKRKVIVGICIDSHSRELLNWALVKVAEPGDCVIAVHVCRNSGRALKSKPLLDGYLEVYDGLCSVNKVHLTGQVSSGTSVRRTLLREAKNHAAVALVVGISNQSSLGSWYSMAKYCAKLLPPTTDVLAIHNGKIVFRRCNNNQLPGLSGDPKPSFDLTKSSSPKEIEPGLSDSESGTELSSFDEPTKDETQDSKDKVSSPASERKRRSTSFVTETNLDQSPGWPLLGRATYGVLQTLHARELSVVQWAMSLPKRDPLRNHSEIDRLDLLEESTRISFTSDELEFSSEMLPNASTCKRFSYEVVKRATSNFHSDNLIGKGGCNRVYKGILQDGKPVAVKIQKSSQKARKDFAREIDIISSLKHEHITPLVGFCIEDTRLISVYDFSRKGSLEENLHGKNKAKSELSWELRYNVAVKIAEALNHLHNECSRPVIHRDVKSSNILLSDCYQPQLSDFGLAIWAPTTSSFVTLLDVVGTFGYLAPEYFMYGKVSDKIDVYAFGVVLLELLSGRKPIGLETPNGHESLVMWAQPIIESGNAREILDPSLDGKLDEVQMRRMVLAATLCITRAARLRPKMSEILKLLRGDNDAEKWLNPNDNDVENPENKDDGNDNDDEVYPNSSTELHLSVALLDVDDDSTSMSSWEAGNNLSLEEYMRERSSRSSSFN